MSMREAPTVNVSTMQLQYLVAVDRSRTWAKAADSIGVTQSALSQGIAELERRLGIELFAWSGRRRVPLSHTAEVVTYARRVLAETGDLGRRLAQVRTGHVGRLRIGVIDAAAVDHFPQTFRAFRAARPQLDFHVSVAPTGELLERLRGGEIDIAVCVDPVDHADIDVVPLLAEELAVYAPPHALVGVPATWGPWVLFPERSITRQAIDSQLRALGAPVRLAAESHQPEVLCEMVRLGIGWSVLPTVQAEKGPEPLRRARNEPLVLRTLVAATRQAAPAHPAAVELIAALCAHSTTERAVRNASGGE